MRKSDSNLEEKSLRKRIDGINFTLTKPFDCLSQCDSGLLAPEQASIVKNISAEILHVLRIDFKFSNYEQPKIVLDFNKERGIYIEIYFKKIDLFVVVQFKGFFFIKENALPSCRVTIMSLIERLGAVFRVSMIDLAQDFLVPINELLPYSRPFPENIRYCFKHKSRIFFDNNSSDNIFTGYVLSSSRYEVKVYDKIRETKGAKNPEKRKYYEDLYGAYENIGVTRIELRLRQELCRDIFNYFIDFNICEDELISLCLKKFYSKHKLRVQPERSTDDDWRRWPVHPNWHFIFSPDSKISLECKTGGDFLYTSLDKDLQKSLLQIAEKLVLSDPSVTETQIRERLATMDLGDVLPKAKLKLKRRHETLEHLEKMKDEILQKYETPLIQGNKKLWVPITSTVERNQTKESNT